MLLQEMTKIHVLHSQAQKRKRMRKRERDGGNNRRNEKGGEGEMSHANTKMAFWGDNWGDKKPQHPGMGREGETAPCLWHFNTTVTENGHWDPPALIWCDHAPWDTGSNRNSILRNGNSRRNTGHCSHLDNRHNHNSRNHNLEIIPNVVVDS